MCSWLIDRGALVTAGALAVSKAQPQLLHLMHRARRRYNLRTKISMRLCWAVLAVTFMVMFLRDVLWAEPSGLLLTLRPAWVLAAADYVLVWLLYLAVSLGPGTSQTYTPYATSELMPCLSCHKPRPKRARHCHRCQACVLRMDHHCEWTACCIGVRNHGLFYLWLGAQLVRTCNPATLHCPHKLHILTERALSRRLFFGHSCY